MEKIEVPAQTRQILGLITLTQDGWLDLLNQWFEEKFY